MELQQRLSVFLEQSLACCASFTSTKWPASWALIGCNPAFTRVPSLVEPVVTYEFLLKRLEGSAGSEYLAFSLLCFASTFVPQQHGRCSGFS